MSASSEAWRENFRVTIECTRCGADFLVDRPIVGTEKVPGKHYRTVTVYAPESCPDCVSLHSVPECRASRLPPSPLGSPPTSPGAA